jgi:hypothetical protein
LVLICSNTAGTAGVVFNALTELANCDPGLYMQTITSDPISASELVVYRQEKPATFWSSRLLEIASHPRAIWIYPGDAYLIEPQEHKFVSESGGAVTRSFSDGSAAVYIDIDDFRGTHYRVPAAGGGTVWNPLNVMLAHELAHAYHNNVKGDAPASHHAQEVQARIDENVFRSQIGMKPLRDINIDLDPGQGQAPSVGGLTYDSCLGKYDGWNCRPCNIATATLGSPVARQIAEFRRAKRELEQFTLASVPLLKPMLDSYALFSPAIADDVRSDADLRQAMLHFGVQPAVHLLQVVRTHINTRGELASVAAQLGVSIGRYLSELPNDARQHVPTAASAASRAARSLTCGLPDTPGIEAQDITSEIFARVVSAVRECGADAAGPAWVLDGLALFLCYAAETGRDNAEPWGVGNWLARIPLPPRLSAYNSAAIGRELDLLRNSLFPDRRDAELFESRLRGHLAATAAPSTP